jgi:hypothetical protein
MFQGATGGGYADQVKAGQKESMEASEQDGLLVSALDDERN